MVVLKKTSIEKVFLSAMVFAAFAAFAGEKQAAPSKETYEIKLKYAKGDKLTTTRKSVINGDISYKMTMEINGEDMKQSFDSPLETNLDIVAEDRVLKVSENGLPLKVEREFVKF